MLWILLWVSLPTREPHMSGMSNQQKTLRVGRSLKTPTFRTRAVLSSEKWRRMTIRMISKAIEDLGRLMKMKAAVLNPMRYN